MESRCEFIAFDEWFDGIKGDFDKEEIRKAAKALFKEDPKCMCCDIPVWVAGSALCGWKACFSCVTGESDPSDDYEIEPGSL